MNNCSLVIKKRVFGKNRYLGIGGKKEKEETVEEVIRREVQQEIGLIQINYHSILCGMMLVIGYHL